MSKIGTAQNSLLVAIVGSGPSGFYAAEALLKSGLDIQVNMLERLPNPYGLVRSGVAPDHPKLKQAIQVYGNIAESPGFNFLGNVTVGRDITVDELQHTHHAIIFTCGAESDRKLGIPGEDLPGSYTATEFVGWYNGHVDYRDRQFDLSHETAVIIGQGNVAADVSRILAKDAAELEHTDIADHALRVLAESRIKNIYVVGRRGPVQAKFTSKELKEFGHLHSYAPVIEPQELELNPESEAELADKANAGARKNFELFQQFALPPDTSKPGRCHFTFLKSPVEIKGNGKVERIILEKNRLSGEPFRQAARGTGETIEIDAGIIFRSIGYRGTPLPGVPFDESQGVFPNTLGRITDQNDNPIAQLYTAGWIKRGPTGIIGTNRACSVETVASLLHDIDLLDSGEMKSGYSGICQILDERNVRSVSFVDWKKIDQQELVRGEPKGKPREKITSVVEMLEILGSAS
jgi:ferredoxin--NADP+ reductase